MICDCCGGRGQVIDRITGRWVNCPKCQSLINEVKNTTNNIAESSITPNMLDILKIPKVYKDIKYSAELILSHDRFFRVTDLHELANICDKIRDTLNYGDLPTYSYYIHCPPVIDINVWVYTLQRIAITKNISTVPYITINELTMYIDDMGYKPEYIDYINAKLCILDVSARLTQISASTLADLLNVRAKKGLPTIVTGYWGADTLINGTSAMRYLITDDEYHLNVLHGNSVHYKSGRQKYNNVVQTKSNDVKSDDIASATLKYM